ncbi:MAG: hypothetical protein NT105_03165 [Verrucomicrobia bacterium]|nr:hypothetical protein [Verrucomicrobiota bacterium]
MKTNTIATIVLVGIIAFSLAACSKSDPPLDRARAASILESQPWGTEQAVQFSREQMSSGVTAGLWTFKPAHDGGPLNSTYAFWEPTAEGKKLGLDFMVDQVGNGQPVGRLKPGFSVSVRVTGLSADASGAAGRSHVEATVAAKIAHPCFSTGVPFWVNGKVDVPIGFTFALFDDGWRVVR